MEGLEPQVLAACLGGLGHVENCMQSLASPKDEETDEPREVEFLLE